jgi:hypothetical protein
LWTSLKVSWRREETLASRIKNGKWERWGRWGLPHPIYQGYYTILVSSLDTIELNHIARALWSDSSFLLIRRPLRLLTGSFAATRTSWCRHVSSIHIGTSAQVLRRKSRKPAIDGFEAKPPNRRRWFWGQTTKPPRHAKSSRLARSTCMSAVLTWLTRSRDVHLHLSMSQVSATRLVTWRFQSLSLSLTSALHCPRSVGMARPTWPSPHRRPPSPSSTPAHHKPSDTLFDTLVCQVSIRTESQCWHVDNRSSQKLLHMWIWKTCVRRLVPILLAIGSILSKFMVYGYAGTQWIYVFFDMLSWKWWGLMY